MCGVKICFGRRSCLTILLKDSPLLPPAFPLGRRFMLRRHFYPSVIRDEALVLLDQGFEAGGAGSACSSLPGLKRTALPGGMLTCCPVRGLRPMPVLRGFTLKTPKRRSSIRSPRPSAFFMASKTVSTACSAFVRVILVFATMAFTMSSLITRSSRRAEAYARQGFAGCQAPRRVITFAALRVPQTRFNSRGGSDVGEV